MWKVEYLREALEDMKQLDHEQPLKVVKAVTKVAVNPLPQTEGGYGKPLGKKEGTNLTGYCKIRLLKLKLRVVYSVLRDESRMRVIVVSARAEDEAYLVAHNRMRKRLSSEAHEPH